MQKLFRVSQNKVFTHSAKERFRPPLGIIWGVILEPCDFQSQTFYDFRGFFVSLKMTFPTVLFQKIFFLIIVEGSKQEAEG